MNESETIDFACYIGRFAQAVLQGEGLLESSQRRSQNLRDMDDAGVPLWRRERNYTQNPLCVLQDAR